MKKGMLSTALIGNTTLKTDVRIIFFGACDELSSYIMELSHYVSDNDLKIELQNIVPYLSKIMGVVAGSKSSFGEDELNVILQLINKYHTSPKVLDHFVLPGQNLISAKTHIVRTVARRCELNYAMVYEKYSGNDYIFEFLNKLSTFFYELALFLEK